MPCDSKVTVQEKSLVVEDLAADLQTGKAKIVVGVDGAISLEGFDSESRDMSDMCVLAHAALEGSWEVRQAIMAAGISERDLIAAHSHSHR